jgi:hypothetical protein
MGEGVDLVAVGHDTRSTHDRAKRAIGAGSHFVPHRAPAAIAGNAGEGSWHYVIS